MPHDQRGLAVALSLSGKAAKVARAFPHNLLADQFGLTRLIAALEREFASESQDLIRHHLRTFTRFTRNKGTNLAEYITAWELLYNQASIHGLQLSAVGQTHQLLEQARLTLEEEDKVLVQVGYDYSRFDQIRAIRGGWQWTGVSRRP